MKEKRKIADALKEFWDACRVWKQRTAWNLVYGKATENRWIATEELKKAPASKEAREELEATEADIRRVRHEFYVWQSDVKTMFRDAKKRLYASGFDVPELWLTMELGTEEYIDQYLPIREAWCLAELKAEAEEEAEADSGGTRPEALSPKAPTSDGADSEDKSEDSADKSRTIPTDPLLVELLNTEIENADKPKKERAYIIDLARKITGGNEVDAKALMKARQRHNKDQ